VSNSFRIERQGHGLLLYILKGNDEADGCIEQVHPQPYTNYILSLVNVQVQYVKYVRLVVMNTRLLISRLCGLHSSHEARCEASIAT